jgi:hypothetical protein
MRKCALLFSFSLALATSEAQLDFKNSNLGRMIDVTDLQGNSLLKQYDADVQGSPYLFDYWVPATITLSKGKIIGPVQVKLNIESSELYYRDSAGQTMTPLPGLVRKIQCVDIQSKDSTKYTFKSGFPAIDQQNENYFYQSLSEGEVELVAKKYKYIRTVRDAYTSESTKNFEEGSTLLYVYADGKMEAFQSTRSFVLSLFNDKTAAITRFMDDNRINLKKTPDVVKLFRFYNRR